MKQLIGFLAIVLLFLGLRFSGLIECSAATFNFQNVNTTILQDFESLNSGIQKLAEKNLSKTFETGSFETMPAAVYDLNSIISEEEKLGMYIELEQDIIANTVGSEYDICLYINDFTLDQQKSLLLHKELDIEITSYIDIIPHDNSNNFRAFTRSSTFQSNLLVTGPATNRFVKEIILEMYTSQIIDLLKYHINSPKSWSKGR